MAEQEATFFLVELTGRQARVQAMADEGTAEQHARKRGAHSGSCACCSPVLCSVEMSASMRLRLRLLSALLFLAVCAVHADVYINSPRGSNNRLDERNRDRDNGDRLFDSQVSQRQRSGGATDSS